MTDVLQDSLPTSLADMLPVGMITGGGLAAAAMATVAQGKRQQAGWEAFHYERISASEFEITGGIAITAGGQKKFQGAHDCVVVTEAEVLATMQQQNTSQTAVIPPFAQTFSHQSPVIAASAPAQYLKVVFALPQDEAGQQRILRAFQLQADFFGAKVQACSLHDASLLKLD
ncbi:hypothetical protein [Undibacterium sp. TJN19]|uniref:hypothetical protein n=1 Tax=Undibacterium sp. TJN19 TaxID=3413055 RepID=UPI003BF4283D